MTKATQKKVINQYKGLCDKLNERLETKHKEVKDSITYNHSLKSFNVIGYSSGDGNVDMNISIGDKALYTYNQPMEDSALEKHIIENYNDWLTKEDYPMEAINLLKL